MQIALFIVGLLLFIGLVLVHEWGHFIAARRNGVVVQEFGLGFPPRAFSKRLKSKMLLSVNWLPLGGFVKLKGEHDADRAKGSFGAASTWTKSKILLAGVTMNFLVGILMLTILATVGLPKIITSDSVGQDQFTVASDEHIAKHNILVGYIEPDSPAAKAGLIGRDIIKSISSGGQTRQIDSAVQLKEATTAFAGKTVNLAIMHGGQQQVKVIKLRTAAEVEASKKTDNPKGHLGIAPTDIPIARYTWSAPIVALGFTKQLIVLTMQGIGHALSGLGSTIAGLATGNHTARLNGQDQASAQVGGPVAITAVLWGGGSIGINFILMVVAIISLTLALMNILPIPALDGGRLFVMLASRVFRKPLSASAEEAIHGTGMAVLLGLFVLVTLVDIRRFL